MHRRRQGRFFSALTRPGVPVLLFCLCAAFFNWPLLSASLDGTLMRAHLSLFTIWGVFVLLLWLVSRALARAKPDDEA